MKKLLFFLPVLIIGAAAFFVLKFNPMVVKTENVLLHNVSCVNQDEIKSDAPLLKQNILLINEAAIEKKISLKYYCVRSVAIERKFPNNIEIDLEGRLPSLVLYSKVESASISAQVSNFLADINPSEATPSSQSALLEDVIADPTLSYSGNSYLVDNQGVIFSQSFGNSTLPSLIFYNKNLGLGERIDPGIVNGTLSVLSKLKELSLPVGLALVKDEGLGVKNPNMSLFFALNSDLDRQLASLQLIFQASTMKMEENTGSKQQKINSIDLRFNKPVVVYSQ